MLDQSIKQLVSYGVSQGLLPENERCYATNLILDLYREDTYDDSVELEAGSDLEAILEPLLEEAIRRGIIPDAVWSRDQFDTRLMSCLTPRPGQVIQSFWEQYRDTPKRATDYFHHLCTASNYIRAQRIQKDQHWNVDTQYGTLEISINLSKPEKDPVEIAAAQNAAQSGYPKCQLCVENEGYAGRINHPARGNLRIIPLRLNGENWGLQYSPYAYFNEHCIVLRREHLPMRIERDTFRRLFDFVQQFPHYFVGANADLPIVGGSILAHDHFQGGGHVFPMAVAPVTERFELAGFPNVTCGIVRWPMSVLRLHGKDAETLVDLADHVLRCWRSYSDEEACIFAQTDGVPHNTITPIARMEAGEYELDLILRNNLTTEQYPAGVFHAHPEYHHIKKENIGLIEAMGLAILPARLEKQLQLLTACLEAGNDPAAVPEIAMHADWVRQLAEEHSDLAENAGFILKQEIGRIFEKILENSGVFKRTDAGMQAFRRFIAYCNREISENE